MAIGTYSELQTAVAAWLHRSDLTSVIQDCIALAEERFNKRLRTRNQETALSSTAIDASYQVAIPSNTVAVKTMWRVDGSEKIKLYAQPLEFIMPRQAAGGTALNYAWEASTWRFDGTGTVAGVLYRTIPALSGTSTNWLLTAHPSLYLYATMYEACVYTRDDTGMAFYEARTNAKLSEVMATEKAAEFSGPLQVRKG